MTALPPLNGRKFVLATDLDGTFLGGTSEDRQALYTWIEAHRDTIGLIFVTGRDPDHITQLCNDGLPWPEYVVGDVGTTIAQVEDRQQRPLPALEAEIAAAWDDAGDKVRDALADHPGLTLQPVEFRYRISYDMDPRTVTKASAEAVEELGLDWLISDNKYFDVLPKGISKGPSLKRLVAHLGIAPGVVLCAGDTLNDLSMLECGLPAVAVGGSETALVDRVCSLSHVHIAKAVGAAGIIEAVKVFDLHKTPEGY